MKVLKLLKEWLMKIFGKRAKPELKKTGMAFFNSAITVLQILVSYIVLMA